MADAQPVGAAAHSRPYRKENLMPLKNVSLGIAPIADDMPDESKEAELKKARAY